MSRWWRRVIGAQRGLRMLSRCGVAVLALATGCTTGLDRRHVEMLTCAGI
jgi:hypothetical protein